MIESLNETEMFRELSQFVGQPMSWNAARQIQLALLKVLQSMYVKTVEVTECRVVEDDTIEFTIRVLAPTQRTTP